MRTANLIEMIALSKSLAGPCAEAAKAATIEDSGQQLVVGAALAAELDRRGFEVTYRRGEPGGWWCWVHDREAIETTHADHPSTTALWPLDSWDDKSIREINGMPGLVARGFSADQPDALRHAALGWLRETAIAEHSRHATPLPYCMACLAAAGQAMPGIATRSDNPAVAAAAAQR